MVTLTEDDAWRMAMAAAVVLRGRVCLLEARDESGAVAGFRGSVVPQYDWIDVQVFDPKSRAFAALPTTSIHSEGAKVDYAAYARATRQALDMWSVLARRDGFSGRKNPLFWRRVLREVTPSCHGEISDVPRFFDTPGVVFPRFRLVFEPRDCYDDDVHDESEAVDWIHTFCDAFFSDSGLEEEMSSEVENEMAHLRLYTNHVDHQPPTPLQVVFRVPMKRTHGPLGALIEQHRGFLRHSQALATRLIAENTAKNTTRFHVVDALAMMRGSIRPHAFVEIAPFFQASRGLHVAGLCVDIVNDSLLDAFAIALETAAVTSLTFNVGKSTLAAITSLSKLLLHCPTIRTLRLVNAFAGNGCAQWEQLGRALCHSTVEELLLERTCLDTDEAEAFRAAHADATANATGRLLRLTIKPLVTVSVSTPAYVRFVKTLGASLQQLGVGTLCLTSTQIDDILRSCPHVHALCLGTVVDGIEDSGLLAALRQRTCGLRALTMSCSERDARCIAAVLSNQSPEIALAGTHLKELRLHVETVDLSTRDALLHLLDTNESLCYVDVTRRSRDGTAPWPDKRLEAHHQRPLMRKLPIANTLAFLSILSRHGVASTPTSTPTLQKSALDRFDAGVASEIVSFAGHAVCRRLRCR